MTNKRNRPAEPTHRLVDLSDRRRVLVAGDVHGEFGLLTEMLDQHGFDGGQDALVLLGDIADHGPHSHLAIDWITRPWVHRVRGDHCEMPAMHAAGDLPKDLFEDHGGDWYIALPPARLRRIASALADAPAALTVITPAGRRVGMTHADCLGDWNTQIEAIAPESPWRSWALDLTTWTPRTLHAIIAAKAQGRPLPADKVQVAGIDHVFHGHIAIKTPFTIANRSWLDTGACYGGSLTVVDVDQWIDTIASRRSLAEVPLRLERWAANR